MASRKIVLANGEIYHLFNRGVEHRDVFLDTHDYKRAIEVLDFYRFNPKTKFSDFKNFPTNQRNTILQGIYKLPQIVKIISYCLMPNHFHLLLRQEADYGISTFLGKFSNSYTKYFNTREKRDGSLFGGTFKAVRIENQQQLLHISRYIQINPVVSCLIKPENLNNYLWSSFPEFMGESGFCDKDLILSEFKSIEDYRNFILDQVDYARTLNELKHALIDAP